MKRQITLTHLTTEHQAIAKLYSNIVSIDCELQALDAAPFLTKSQHATSVINKTRDTLFDIVSTLHSIKNDIDRLYAGQA